MSLIRPTSSKAFCHFCKCPGATLEVDTSTSYVDHTWTRVCGHCLARFLRYELARQPQEMGT